jgi:hypothetical protein
MVECATGVGEDYGSSGCLVGRLGCQTSNCAHHLDSLFRNFDDHVKSAYKWLMDYYQYARHRVYFSRMP